MRQTDFLFHTVNAVRLSEQEQQKNKRVKGIYQLTVTTQLICHDGRWFYFLQETHIKDKVCSSALIKAAFTSKQGLVPATEVLAVYGRPTPNFDVPDWVNAWIDAESQRPWPQ